MENESQSASQPTPQPAAQIASREAKSKLPTGTTNIVQQTSLKLREKAGRIDAAANLVLFLVAVLLGFGCYIFYHAGTIVVQESLASHQTSSHQAVKGGLANSIGRLEDSIAAFTAEWEESSNLVTTLNETNDLLPRIEAIDKKLTRLSSEVHKSID